MSTWTDLDVACPACGAEQRATVALSINVGRAPKWRDVILADELHRYACRACTKSFRVDVQFDYVDFDRKQLFVIFPERDEPRWRTLESVPRGLLERNVTDPTHPAFVRALGEGFVLRTLFGTRALREKLLVFDAGLDDVAVEMVKLAWMRERGIDRLFSRPRVDSIRDGEVVLVVPRGGKLDSFAVGVDELRAAAVQGEAAQQLRASTYVDVGRWTVVGETR